MNWLGKSNKLLIHRQGMHNELLIRVNGFGGGGEVKCDIVEYHRAAVANHSDLTDH
jgi:hypothetical protein